LTANPWRASTCWRRPGTRIEREPLVVSWFRNSSTVAGELVEDLAGGGGPEERVRVD
jgi:hypothetical protein